MDKGTSCANANSRIILNKNECKVAANLIGKGFVYTMDENTPESLKWPTGCFYGQIFAGTLNFSAGIYYNPNLNGKNNINASPLCQKGNTYSIECNRRWIKKKIYQFLFQLRILRK